MNSVYNLTRRCYINRKQALRRKEQGLVEFVDADSIRELALPEIVAKRAEQARREISTSNPLHKRSEIPGIIFRPPTSDQWQDQHGFAQREIARQAYEASQPQS